MSDSPSPSGSGDSKVNAADEFTEPPPPDSDKYMDYITMKMKTFLEKQRTEPTTYVLKGRSKGWIRRQIPSSPPKSPLPTQKNSRKIAENDDEDGGSKRKRFKNEQHIIM